MKKYTALLLVCSSYTSFAQSIKINEIVQSETVNLISSIESFNSFAGKQLRLGIIKVSNGSGSAKLPESDESSSNLLISVAHYDEDAESKIFSIGPFIAPKVIRKVDADGFVTLFVKYGIHGMRKTAEVIVTETDVKIQQ